MASGEPIDLLVREAASQRVLYLPHAIRQMALPDRLIERSEVRYVLQTGRIIEDYPDDVRGHSCLILGHGIHGRPLHVVCAPKRDYLAIITAYIPETDQWQEDYQTRRRK